jgi:colanic acid biosynthesis glycosyl transferase WcaI
VVRPGRVPAADRDGMYACASALVWPSRYEGFGAPVLEAMRAGCAVISSDATCLPEVTGGAAMLLDPLDTDAWVDAIDRVVADPVDPCRACGGRARACPCLHRRPVGGRAPRRVRSGPRMRIVVLCPHFAPDVAPTGEVITRIVTELAARGHELHVVTALPWYLHHRVEPEWQGKVVRRERTAWGSITRVHPFPTDKRSIPQRALAFGAFSALSGVLAAFGGQGRRGALDVAAAHARAHRPARSRVRRSVAVFNVQDVFPDVAVELGAITNRRVIAGARWLERVTYERSAAVTVLSDDLRDNLVAKVHPAHAPKIRVIPNFVDTSFITPGERMNSYRAELGIGVEPVVMYAGNVGLSQSLGLIAHAARELRDQHVTFVVNGGGSGLVDLRAACEGLDNVRFAPLQPKARLPEVLAAGDIHLVPLKRGLAASSVPSKSYSILAAGRPLLASIDEGTEVARMVQEAQCGVAVPPDDPAAFLAALRSLLVDPQASRAMGERGRAHVERWLSPAAVAQRYEELFEELVAARRGDAAGRPRRSRQLTGVRGPLRATLDSSWARHLRPRRSLEHRRPDVRPVLPVSPV